MTLQLSPELQHALHGCLNELELVDPLTDQRYVIVAKDRWLERTAIERPATRDRGQPANASEAVHQWTDDKHRRRAELVDRDVAGILTDGERAELELLQYQMRAYREKVAPLPLEDMRRLHAELMEKARRAQARKA